MKFTQWLLFSSGVLSALLVSVTYQGLHSPQTAQAQPLLLAQTTTDQLPQLPPSNWVEKPTAPLQVVPAPAAASVQANAALTREPMMMMSVPEGSVNVRIDNMTGESITYEALGDTEPRTLAAEGKVTLSNLRVPTTVTFSYEGEGRDRAWVQGLTMAEVSTESDGTLHLVVRPTDDLSAEASNLTVESNGGVFVF